MTEVSELPNNWSCGNEHMLKTRTVLCCTEPFALADRDEELKHLLKVGGLVCISATRCRKKEMPNF